MKQKNIDKILSNKKWHSAWMDTAERLAQLSCDPRLQVCAIIVPPDNNQILSFGYNGNYRKGPNAPDSLEPGKSGFIHAEMNALFKFDFNNHKKKIMYITHSPCLPCAKAIINSYIDMVIYKNIYRDDDGLKLLFRFGLPVYKLDSLI